ncbi:MAG: hypothetical protein E6R03_05110 [Hyphomicrobiaceae bacterium]|nr:MAG: hypothetical protein E6R03_05110 [Hyphomicrobiaceae bacterium]
MPAEFVYHYSGGTHVLDAESWTYNKSRKTGIEWSVVLTAPIYWPKGEIGATFEPFQVSGEAPARDLDEWVIATLSRPGRADEVSPKLAILDVARDQTVEGFVIELSGTDEFFEKLLFEAVVLGDRRSTSSTVYTENGVIEEVAEACGIEELDATDHTVHNLPVFHAVGQGLQLVQDLMDLTQGWLKPESDGLKVRDGGIDPDEETPSFVLNEDNCGRFSDRKRSTGIYNEATYERVAEVHQAFGPENRVGYGIDTVSLNFPVNNATLRVYITNGQGSTQIGQGSVKDVKWKSGGSYLSGATDFTYRGETAADEVEFNVEPSVAWGANNMTYLVEVVGSPSITEVAPFEADYKQTYADPGDQGRRKRLPFPEPFASEICPDQATALMAATRKVKEQLLSYWTAEADCTMDPERDVGQVCAVTLPKFDLDAKPFLVESVKRSGDKTQEIEGLELARGS